MNKADIIHPNSKVSKALEFICTLNLHAEIDLGFRPPYLRLLEKLGNPHKNLPPVIHIAGTNGKGSTIAFMRSILENAGYSVHAYTSPHLTKFNERILLSGENVSDDTLLTLLDSVIELNYGEEITSFEITTALAFKAFEQHKADVLLLETGMGGRLDSTNIIDTPSACVITHISKDHTDYLGNTIEEITKEKAGIIKRGVPCIVGKQKSAQIADILTKTCESLDAPLFLHGRDWVNDTQMTRTSMQGQHQIDNCAIAIETLKHLPMFKIRPASYRNGIAQTYWVGRLDKVIEKDGWEIWLDGGHNEGAAIEIAKWIRSNNDTPTHVIFGMKNDKDPNATLKHIRPAAQSLHFAQIADASYQFDNMRSYQESIQKITKQNKEGGKILICGSLYLVGEVLRQIDELQNCISR